MKKFRTLILAALVLIISSADLFSAPKLTMPETEFDFGYVPQNSKISHVFWLHSTGDDSLKITKVMPGCGCTQAPLDKDILAAGDSTRLNIIFDTRTYTNAVVKRPQIETNEGTPNTFVQISSTVLSNPDSTFPVIIKPYKLDISQSGEKVRDQITFKITNASKNNLELTLVSGLEDIAQVTLPKSVAAGQSAEGVVKLNTGTLDDSFERSLTFQVNDEQKSRFTIPIKRTLRVPGQATDSPASPKEIGSR
ncbi:MAG: DUF1573 domain-containing protein [candidate division Zixibacteria bacterium]|nr:DUF1573 domain-containing protein [candidate division Zixibacteria bacterium]